MNAYRTLLTTLFLLFANAVHAGTAMPMTSSTPVPIDSPWVILGMALSLAVIGARILHNRRK